MSESKQPKVETEEEKNRKNLTFLKVAPTKAKTGKLEYKLSGASTNLGPKNRGIRNKEGKIVHQLAPGQVVDWKNVINPKTNQPAFTDSEIREMTESKDPDYFIYDMLTRLAGWKSDVLNYVKTLNPEFARNQDWLAGHFWITGANYKDKNSQVVVTDFWNEEGKLQKVPGGTAISAPDLIAWEKAKSAHERISKKSSLPMGALPAIADAISKIDGSMMAEMGEMVKKDPKVSKKFFLKNKEIPNVEYEPRAARVSTTTGTSRGTTLADRLKEVMAYNAEHPRDKAAWKYVDISAANGRGKVIAASEIDTDTTGKNKRRTRLPLENYVPSNRRDEFKHLVFNASYSPETGKFKYEQELRDALNTLGLSAVAESILTSLPKDRKGRTSKSAKTPEKTVASAPAPANLNLGIPSLAAVQRS